MSPFILAFSLCNLYVNINDLFVSSSPVRFQDIIQRGWGREQGSEGGEGSKGAREQGSKGARERDIKMGTLESCSYHVLT